MYVCMNDLRSCSFCTRFLSACPFGNLVILIILLVLLASLITVLVTTVYWWFSVERAEQERRRQQKLSCVIWLQLASITLQLKNNCCKLIHYLKVQGVRFIVLLFSLVLPGLPTAPSFKLSECLLFEIFLSQERSWYLVLRRFFCILDFVLRNVDTNDTLNYNSEGEMVKSLFMFH